MLPLHHHIGDFRHPSHRPPLPNWLAREFDSVPIVLAPVQRRLRIPVWPGFRLTISFERTSPAGGCNV